jgi:hypothetical protein
MRLLLTSGPRRLSTLQLRGTLDARIEDGQRMVDAVLREELIRKFEQEPARFAIDFDIAHQIRIGMSGFQFFNQALDLVSLCRDLLQLFGLRLNRRSEVPSASGPGSARRRLLRQRGQNQKKGKKKSPHGRLVTFNRRASTIYRDRSA